MQFYLTRRSSRKPRRQSPPREEHGTQKLEEKAIWVLARHPEPCCYSLVCFKLSLSKNPPPTSLDRSAPYLNPALPNVPEGIPGQASTLISGSTFYLLGGLYGFAPQRNFHYLDRQHHRHVWKVGPPMLHPRFSPACVDVDGKIYVFGGLTASHPPHHFAEVFDPKTNAWEPLTPPRKPLPPPRKRLTPPRKRSEYFPTATTTYATAYTDPQHGPIILVNFHHLPVLLAYLVYDGSWTSLDSHFGYGLRCINVVDKVLYCLRSVDKSDVYCCPPYTLGAYDLGHNRWLSVNCDLVDGGGNAALLHLGGDRLCFVRPKKIDRYVVAMCCWSFSVEKVMELGVTLCSITTNCMTYQEFYMRTPIVVNIDSSSVLN